MTPDAAIPAASAQAFILAGGASLRMGTDKARLPWRGGPLVHAIRDAIAPCVAHVWLVCKPDSGCEDLGLPVVYDPAPERALVHGLQTALAAPGPPWRFVLACDMPGVDASVLQALWAAAQAAAAPGSYPERTPGGIEPVPSLWHRSVAALAQPAWGLAARDWIARAGLAAWPVPAAQDGALANVNTPQEWQEWQWRANGGTAKPR